MQRGREKTSLLGHLKNFPFGLFVGAALALLLATTIDGDVGEELAKNRTYIFSALMTLIAASIALAGVLFNTGNQSALNERNRLAHLKAAKAVLPLALSHMNQVARKGLEFSLQTLDLYHDKENLKTVKAALDLGDSVLPTLRDCIEYADPVSGDWLSLIIQKYQLCFARLLGAMEDDGAILGEDSPAYHAVDWVELLAFIDHIWPYARAEQPVPNLLEAAKICMPIASIHWLLPSGRRVQDIINNNRQHYGVGCVQDYSAKMPEI